MVVVVVVVASACNKLIELCYVTALTAATLSAI